MNQIINPNPAVNPAGFSLLACAPVEARAAARTEATGFFGATARERAFDATGILPGTPAWRQPPR